MNNRIVEIKISDNEEVTEVQYIGKNPGNKRGEGEICRESMMQCKVQTINSICIYKNIHKAKTQIKLLVLQ